MNAAKQEKTISPFTLMAFIGVAVAVIQSGILLHSISLDWWVLPLMFGVSSIAFLFLGLLTKVFTGKENHVMLRYFIFIMLFNYAVIHWMKLPVFPYLDILAMGYGTIIFFGRIGCFRVGCCHGKPASIGVCYAHRHVKEGFTYYYSGIRLFPVQLLEAVGLIIIISVSLISFLGGSPEGTGLSIFITLYSALRLVLEFFRGDPSRPYFLSFSEAQWTAFVLTGAIVVAGWKGVLPVAEWQILICSVVAALLPVIGIVRLIRPQFRITEPAHIHELLTLNLGQLTGPVKVRTTSLGINVSGSVTSGQTQYTVSARKFKMDDLAAKKIAGILLIRHPEMSLEILAKQHGIFQLIFYPKS